MSKTKRRLERTVRIMRGLAKLERSKEFGIDWSIDWEAYVNKSWNDTEYRMNALKAVRVFHDYFNRPRYSPGRDCSRCERDDRGQKTTTSRRPPGAYNRRSCHGCAVSFLESTVDLEELRDRLLARWVRTREALRDLVATRAYQDTERRKKRWRAGRDRLRDELEAVEEACRQVGINPKRRKRPFARRSGVFPGMMVSGEVTAFFDGISQNG
jgi:hypothetical protein